MVDEKTFDPVSDLQQSLGSILNEMAVLPHAAEILSAQMSEQDKKDLYQAAYRAFDAGDMTLAGQFFALLIAAEPTARDYWMGYGICQRVLGQAASAQDAFLIVLSISPIDLDAHYRLAELAWAQNDLPQARAWFQRCLKAMTDGHMHPLKPALDDLASKLHSSFDGMHV